MDLRVVDNPEELR